MSDRGDEVVKGSVGDPVGVGSGGGASEGVSTAPPDPMQMAWGAGWDAAGEARSVVKEGVRRSVVIEGLGAATFEELVVEFTRRTGYRPMLVDDLAGVLDEAPLEHLEEAVRRRSVPRGTSVRGGGTDFSTGDEGSGWPEADAIAEELGAVAPTRACVALGGSRSTVCGKAVDDGAEGDLCPAHQDEARAIGLLVTELLTRIRWATR